MIGRRDRIKAIRQEILEACELGPGGSKPREELEAELFSLLALGSLPEEGFQRDSLMIEVQEIEKPFLLQEPAQSENWQVPGILVAPGGAGSGQASGSQNAPDLKNQDLVDSFKAEETSRTEEARLGSQPVVNLVRTIKMKTDPLVRAGDWHKDPQIPYLEDCLNRLGQQKRQHLVQDPFFRVGVETFKASIEDCESFFKEYTYIIIKPDGIVTGNFNLILKVLNEDGFEVADYTLFEYTPNSVKNCWFEASRRFPTEWCRLFEMILTGKTSVLFLLRDTQYKEERISACERLTSLKGSAEMSKRELWHLRARIGAGSGLLAYVHTPDSPLDMIREWSILISEKQCRRLLAKKTQIDRQRLVQELQILQEKIKVETAVHDLNLEQSKERLHHYVSGLEPSLQERYLQFISDESLPWTDFVRWLEDHEISIPQWDLITLCFSRRSWQ
ncbi:MAG: nucleoside-diphosphate kinase [Myxococcaceae bacterium]